MATLFQRLRHGSGGRRRAIAAGKFSRKHPLGLQQLEDRTVLTVVFESPLGGDTIHWWPNNPAHQPANALVTAPITNNPYVLNNPTVYLIFWGGSWTPDAISADVSAAKAIIGSPYLSGLKDYGSDGTATFGGYALDISDPPSPSVVSPPVAATQEINSFVPGIASWEKPGASTILNYDNFWPGAPQSPIYVDVFDNCCFDSGNGMDTYAPYGAAGLQYAMNHIWIDGQGSVDNFSDSFSHELVERISSGGTGIYMNAADNITGENFESQIADNEPDGGRYTYRLYDSVLVQAYWSISFNGFIVPDDSGQNLYLYPNWNTQPSTPVYLGNSNLEVLGGQNSGQSGTISLDVANGGVAVNLEGAIFHFDQGVISNTGVYGPDTVNILNTVTPVNVQNSAQASINIGDNGSAGGINAPISIAALPASEALTVDDSADTTDLSDVMVKEDAILNLAPAAITFNSGTLMSLTIKGGSAVTFQVLGTPTNQSLIHPTTTIATGSGTDTINVQGTTGDLVIDGNNAAFEGQDTVNIGSQAPSLSGTLASITGTVTLTNTSGHSTLTLDDKRDDSNESATISGTSITGLSPAPIFYTGKELSSLAVYCGTNCTMTVSGTSTSTKVVGAGDDFLVGPDAATTWDITGSNSGAIPGQGLTFSGFGSLLGGGASNTFAIENGAEITGVINGDGDDTLDYSQYEGSTPSDVVVNLLTRQATAVDGGVLGIKNVIGAHGGGGGFYNILVGNGGDVLTGGDDRTNLLIAGPSASTLRGGGRDDILIGGTTRYDNEKDAHDLVAIMKFWSEGTGTFKKRVNILLNGSPVVGRHGHGVPVLNASKVHSNDSRNTMLGHNGSLSDSNLYYAVSQSREKIDFNAAAGDRFVKIKILARRLG